MTAMLNEGFESPSERERLLESLEAYRRGLADAPLLRKWSGGATGGPEVVVGDEYLRSQKDADSEAPLTFVISSEEVDRHGDVVLAQGWRLQAYLRNPVFLWAHNYGLPVIGRALAVWTEPGQLLARLQFAPTDFANQVAALYRGGYQQGVSVGFKPMRYEERRDGRTGAFLGIRFLEQELLEVSAVPVPANRRALRRESVDRLGMSGGAELGEVLAALRSARSSPPTPLPLGEGSKDGEKPKWSGLFL